MIDRKGHWDKVYRDRGPEDVSWYQKVPEPSFRLIRETGVPKAGGIIDVGGGACVLVDRLLAAGFEDVSILDISPEALTKSKERLGSLAGRVQWIEADATAFVPTRRYELWHDRAVYHFLTDEADRKKYLAAVEAALNPGGALILATFALDGPEKCSGLAVRRHDAAMVREEFGPGFSLLADEAVPHGTPLKTVQKFRYFLLKRL
ncbi:MAG: class I SAM-dependent methyltransferase [Elusimicrobia bacterium]|nr:class I SAM-dependent methyltransferase [Elusimicrobiota bacterium]